MSEHVVSDFKGKDDLLIQSIDSLLAMDAKGILVPHGIGGHARTLLRAAKASIEQACAARTVPEGYVMVPVEPTPEMLDSTSWPRCAETDYKHMLKAAPDSTAATPSDKWVKCSERHPDKSGSYLVMLHEENSMGWNWDEPHIAEWDFWTASPRQWTIFCPDLYKNKEVSGDVTHWMPLPAAPEVKK